MKAAAPEADEAVSGGAKFGMALYSIGGERNVVCGIQPTEDQCKLFFHGWKALQEVGYRLQGSGKHAQHVKFRASEDLEPDTISDMIGIARRHVES